MPQNLYKTLIIFTIALSPASLTFARKAKPKVEIMAPLRFRSAFFPRIKHPWNLIIFYVAADLNNAAGLESSAGFVSSRKLLRPTINLSW